MWLQFEGREHGDCLTLAEIQKLVDDDTDMQDLSKSSQQEYIDALQIHRDTKKTGSRASNVAAAVDCQGVIARVSTEVCIVPEPLLHTTEDASDPKPIGAHWCLRHGFFHPYTHPRCRNPGVGRLRRCHRLYFRGTRSGTNGYAHEVRAVGLCEK